MYYKASKNTHIECPVCTCGTFQIVLGETTLSAARPETDILIVRCSRCDYKYRVEAKGEIYLQPAAAPLPNDPADYQPGDVLKLTYAIGEIQAGLWVVMEVGWMITLARCGENEDGDLCSLYTQVKVTHEEIRQFELMHLNIGPPL